MKPTIIHKENIPEGGFLYAGTHVSYFDGLEVGYKSGIYKKRKIDIQKRYELFIKYLFDHYDKKNIFH